jgi:hypothetical protein
VTAALVVVASAQGALPLQQRVLRASDLPSFEVDRPLEIARSAAAWYHAKRSGQFKESAALQARGFVVGARQHLNGWKTEAVSGVIEFKTPRGARATLRETIAGLRSGSYKLKRFAVPGIPGAQAAATSAVDTKAYSVFFTDGRFWYGVSVVYFAKAAKSLARDSAIGGARALYRRVQSA